MMRMAKGDLNEYNNLLKCSVREFLIKFNIFVEDIARELPK